MIFHNQLRYAVQIVGSYHGGTPLHVWLKDFFREHKQMGSKDRKLVGNMVYGFYRLGHASRHLPAEERILLALFLCNEAPVELLGYFRPGWHPYMSLSIDEKIALCRESGIAFEPADIFPWKDQLSGDIDHLAFCLSFLRQPDLFLRIRPGFEREVRQKLPSYPFIPPAALRLPNGFKIGDLFTPDKEVVVQDLSSQRLAPFLKIPPADAPEPGKPLAQIPIAVWDACAASGGKSILAHDLNPGINLTVSDIRKSILHNLRSRFQTAGIRDYHSFIADLAAPSPDEAIASGGKQAPQGPYGLIIADVPCTGSGTWGRTPEELYFFDPRKIDTYRDTQQRIVSRLVPHLGKGAYLVYSTCSVFKKENEGVAAFIRDGLGFHPDGMQTIKGYGERADTMFAARFIS